MINQSKFDGGSKGLSKTDTVLGMLQVVDARHAESKRIIVVDAGEEGVSRGHVHSFETLLGSIDFVKKWRVDETPLYLLPDGVLQGRAPMSMPRTVHALVSCVALESSLGGATLSVVATDPHFENLLVLEKHGLASRTAEGSSASSWSMTASGESCAKVAWCSVDHSPACEPRDGVQHSAMSAWELAADLESKGWAHEVWPWKEAPTPADMAKGPPKVWYTKPGATSISQSYLLVLCQLQRVAMFQTHTVAEHFHKDSYYRRLVSPKKMNIKMERDMGINSPPP